MFFLSATPTIKEHTVTEPTDGPDANILRKVRALMDKANSTEFEGEADALRAKAMEMMTAYGIEEAMLEATGQKKADHVTKITVTFVNPYSTEKHMLLRAIAVALGCRTLRYPNGKSVSHTDVVGHSSDLERVEFLYTLLLVQAETGAAKVKAKGYVIDTRYGFEQTRYLTTRQVAARTRSLRAAYMAGFAEVINERLTEIRRHAEAQNQATHTAAGDGAPGTALVLASRKELVDNAFRQYFPQVSHSRGRAYNTAGFAAGQAGGRQADLGQDRFGSRGKALTR